MLELTYPWFLLALPLPYLVYRFVPAHRTQRSAIRVPFFSILSRLSPDTPSKGATELKARTWQRIALVVSWCLIVFAMCKPMWLGEQQTRDSYGRDLMVLVDLSGSMSEQDFTIDQDNKVDRLQAVKQVLSDFVAQRDGDRLGLIVFADAPYLQSPFTSDLDAWLGLLNETQLGMAGQSTHLGDAIGLGIKTFADIEQSEGQNDKQKVMLVLTDGNDTESLVPPIDAAKVAAASDIRIHMIAIGDPQTVGEQALDMDVINRVAQLTGGQAFQAIAPSDLIKISETIAALEPKLYASESFQVKSSIHHFPLLIILAIYLLGFSLSEIRTQSRIRSQKAKVGADNV